MVSSDLLDTASRNWGWIALRGVVAILFGILGFMWPAITLGALVLLWGAYALVDGVLALIGAFRVRDRGGPFWRLLLVGVAGIAAGLLAFVMPGITALVLLMFIAAWAILIGVFQVAAAIRLRREIEGEWLLALSGVLSVAFGVLMVLRPGQGALAVVWLLAGYAIVFGVLLLVLGFRLRGLRRPAAAVAG